MCWSGDENSGRGVGGRKLIPLATWWRGVRVVGSTLLRALSADHVTIERWRNGELRDGEGWRGGDGGVERLPGEETLR